MTYVAVAEMKARGDVCLNDGKIGDQHWKTAIGATAGGRWRAQPTCIAFRIALDAPVGYSDAPNRWSSGDVGLKLPFDQKGLFPVCGVAAALA